MLTQQFIEVQSPLVCLSIFNISTPLKEYENIVVDSDHDR